NICHICKIEYGDNEGGICDRCDQAACNDHIKIFSKANLNMVLCDVCQTKEDGKGNKPKEFFDQKEDRALRRKIIKK
ncbi:MAG: hypothetical protein Q7U87_04170, partial [bacterium]|nr:hypothetical protein [bacterium]